MRPKLKPDTYWVPNPDGVSFVHPSGHLNVKGHNALLLMDRLAPHLDGSTSLEELVSGLPDGKVEMVTRLVTALCDAGLVKDTTDEESHELTPRELETYAAEIAYVDYYVNSAGRRFERFRTTPAVCVGSGQTLLALVRAALTCGLRQLTVVVTDTEGTDIARIRELVALRQEHDPEHEVTFTLSDTSASLDGIDREHVGLVLHIADTANPELARRIDHQCRAHGVVAVHGLIVGDEAFVGPVTQPGSHGWESLWLRRSANQPHTPGADPFAAPSDPPSVYLAGPTASLVANRVAFLAMRHLTGVADAPTQEQPAAETPASTRQATSRVDLETLRTTEHRFHAHPAAVETEEVSPTDFRTRTTQFRAAVAAAPDTFSTQATTAFDPQLGVTISLDETELAQIPLCVSRVTVSDPFLLLDTTQSHPQVLGVGDSFTDARRAAAERALAAYCALAVDRRCLPDGGRQAYATDLTTGEDTTIPAELLHPVLAASRTGAEFRLPTGLGWGATANEALREGLLQHCVALTVAALPDTEGRYPRLDLDNAELDEAGTRYRDLLHMMEIPVEVIDVTGRWGVPVYAVCAMPRVVTYTNDLTDGLRRVLLDFQGVGSDPVYQLPVGRRDRRAAVAYEGPTTVGVSELTHALHRNGYQVHAAPVGHDPAATALLPTVVQVVAHV